MQNHKQLGRKKKKKKKRVFNWEMERIQILTESKSTERVWKAQIILGFRLDKVIKKEEGGEEKKIVSALYLEAVGADREGEQNESDRSPAQSPIHPRRLRSRSWARAGAPQLLSAELLAWAALGLLA